MKYDVIITAAGSGQRTGLPVNKIFLELNKKPCILYSIELFLQDESVENIYLTINPNDETRMRTLLEKNKLTDKNIYLVYGGTTRQESVYNALKLVKAFHVFIHDGARPFIQKEKLVQLKKALQFDAAAILTIPAVDTLKEVTATKEVNRTISRKKIHYAQTPQVFETAVIVKCHESAKENDFTATDDSQLVEVYGGDNQVQIVEGNKLNFKITSPEDIYLAELVASKYQKVNRE